MQSDWIRQTVEMFEDENLDVRAVTLGVNLLPCLNTDNPQRLAANIRERIKRVAGLHVEVTDRVAARYGVKVANRRLSVTPIGALLGAIPVIAQHEHIRYEDFLLRKERSDSAESDIVEAYVQVALAIDDARRAIGIDLVGGFSALVHKGMTPSERYLLYSLPTVLARTEAVCSSVNVATTQAGINMDAIGLMGKIVRDTALATREQNSFGAAKLVVYANMPEDNPYMAGACHGFGEADSVINVGVSGPGVVMAAIRRYLRAHPEADLGELYDQVKRTAYKVTKIGELIGQEVARELGSRFGIVDLSLAPTTKEGDSVAQILQELGVRQVGAPGTTAALYLLTDAVKKGGVFASRYVGGMSGAFIPVSEDSYMDLAVRNGTLSLEKLEAMTAVCSVGLDMIAFDGSAYSPGHLANLISGVIADEIAIGVANTKTTAVRLIPVISPTYRAGKERTVVFSLTPRSVCDQDGVRVAEYEQSKLDSNLWGEAYVMDLKPRWDPAAHPDNTLSDEFIGRGGRIPAPIISTRN